MTKLTDMNATERRLVARKHRIQVALITTELQSVVGFTPTFAKLTMRKTFHAAQAKLWDVAAAQAEANGNVTLA